MNITKTVTETLRLETSAGLVEEETVEIEVTVAKGIAGRGWFEIADTKSGGNSWYAEGGLWFQDKKVTEYDGVFGLPRAVINILTEQGYDCSEVS